MWIFALLACQPQLVTLTGVVYDGPGDDASPRADATIEIVAPDDGSVLSEATTDANGAFALELEPNLNVVAILSADGARPTSIPGTTGLPGEQIVEDRAFYVFASSQADEVEALFSDCDGGDGMGLSLGEVRQYELATVASGEHPENTVARVKAILESGDEQVACYWDDAGLGHLPEALVTGATGRFVLPRLPEGNHVLEITYDLGVGVSETQQYPLFIDEGGGVSPWYPAWVGLP
jgi:hypothetical protein